MVNLAGILPLLTEHTAFQNINRQLPGAKTLTIVGLGGAVRPFFLAALQAKLQRPLLVVASRPQQARQLCEQIMAYSANPDLVLSWSTPDTLPYERIAQDEGIVTARIATLTALQSISEEDCRKLLIIASAKGLMQPTFSKTDFAQALLTFEVGKRYELSRVLPQIVRLGYSAESVAESPGQFSRRGGILDIFPAGATLPVRLDFFDDELDTMRPFDPISQRSKDQKIDQVVIAPPVEVPLWRSSQALEKLALVSTADLRAEVAEEWERILNRIDNGEIFEGIEQFVPYFSDQGKICNLLDHLPPETVVVLDGAAQIAFASEELTEQAEELREQFEKGGEMPADLSRPYFNKTELEGALSRFPRLLLNRSDEAEDLTRRSYTLPESDRHEPLVELFASAGEYANQTPRLIAEVGQFLAAKQRVVIVSQQSERLREQFEDNDIFPVIRKDAGAGNRSRLHPEDSGDTLATIPTTGTFHLLKGNLLSGWQSKELGIVVLTDREIFGWTKQSQRGAERSEGLRRSVSQREAFLRDLKPGDYVVHIEHGIARYEGLVRFEPDSNNPNATPREFLFLRYAEQDKLYVPIDQVDRVLPYTAPGQATPTLHRLGSGDWTRTKRKVRSAVEDIAKELLELYSTRQIKQGYAFSPDGAWQREMEDAFPYTETPDQMRAILDVKADMEQARPMDRLICGDVGYGKTEVALRGAFKCVVDGKQVAILVPTTILAQQHFNTFKQRLAAFPTNIELLSRFRTKKQQEETLERLKKGQVDILIGTHRLLQKDVLFKDLGLLVVDEEQRFGVKHKERLKQIKQDVDVLTLSATPIPRTLHMSLAGVRDMSIIETPPEARLPVKTYVTAQSDALVREVILRELERGGQIFFVHNRVSSIAQTANQLKTFVPEARVIIGHGQMEEHELERVMLAFINHEADVLVCTTIIESGLDIPNANTLIIDNAVMYGLAQLYQLRGRVGRGANRGYAYFLYKPNQAMTEDAQKRLDTMLETQELGAGFKIAMKDLEIRGAGNLLGAEQSGNIASVGFELYVRLLEEAVEQLKGADERPIEAQVEAPTVNISLPVHAYLPEDYVQDQALRLDQYRKLAAPVKSASQVRDIIRELEDRFGTLPEPARNLMYVLDIKVLAIRAGIESIIEQEGEIYLRWPAPSLESEMRRQASKKAAPAPVKKPTGRAKVDPRKLMREFGETLRITPNQMRLNIRLLKNNWQERLKDLLEELAS
jgi:transcription-repair coupling factor (superfamily II helicase)